MAEIQDFMIYEVIKGLGGKATKKEIFEALGDDEAREVIEEKLKRWASFGIVVIEGDEVKISRGG